MDLNERKRRILKAIVDDYVATAQPVGSRTLSRRYVQDLSSATLRNEMSDLEEMGLLIQPHTSAGRVPSNLAYRVYVDELMEGTSLPEQERRAIQDLADGSWETEELMHQAAILMSDLTHYTAMVLAPQMRRARLRRIQLVLLDRGSALVVLVTDTAVVKDKIIRIPEEMTEEHLLAVSRILTERFAGHALTDINLAAAQELRQERNRYSSFFDELSRALEDSVVQADQGDLIMEGTVNIFQHPEYWDMERARDFLQMMESHERFYRLMSKRTHRDLSVTIGGENGDADLKDYSVITAGYRVANRTMGTLGVIGPVRMDYAHVIGIMNQVGRSLNTALAAAQGRKHPDKEQKND